MNTTVIIQRISNIQKELEQLKKELQNKLKWSVYYHLLPNGKYYIGIAKDTEQRWLNGEGYKTNAEFYRDIKQYSWNNIKHIILCKTETKEKAESIERVLIGLYNATNTKYGYNKTSYLNFIGTDTERNKYKTIFKKQLEELDLEELERAYQNRKGARV